MLKSNGCGLGWIRRHDVNEDERRFSSDPTKTTTKRKRRRRTPKAPTPNTFFLWRKDRPGQPTGSIMQPRKTCGRVSSRVLLLSHFLARCHSMAEGTMEGTMDVEPRTRLRSTAVETRTRLQSTAWRKQVSTRWRVLRALSLVVRRPYVRPPTTPCSSVHC